MHCQATSGVAVPSPCPPVRLACLDRLLHPAHTLARLLASPRLLVLGTHQSVTSLCRLCVHAMVQCMQCGACCTVRARTHACSACSARAVRICGACVRAVCPCIHACVCVRPFVRACVQVCRCAGVRACTRAHTCMCAYTCVHACVCACVRMHACVRVRLRACMLVQHGFNCVLHKRVSTWLFVQLCDMSRAWTSISVKVSWVPS